MGGQFSSGKKDIQKKKTLETQHDLLKHESEETSFIYSFFISSARFIQTFFKMLSGFMRKEQLDGLYSHPIEYLFGNVLTGFERMKWLQTT